MAFCSTVLSKTLLKSSHIENFSLILPLGNMAFFRVMFQHYTITKNAAIFLIFI